MSVSRGDSAESEFQGPRQLNFLFRLGGMVRHRLLACWLFWRYVCLRFWHDELFTRAAALSFQTALALVPLFTIAITLLSAFPFFQDMQAEVQLRLLNYVVPTVEETVMTAINDFIAKARQLTGFGVLFLAFIAMMLLHTASQTFDAIWRVTQPRTLAVRFMAYWAIITLGPLLFALGISLTAQIIAETQRQVDTVLGESVGLIRVLVPVAMEWLGFAIIYWLAPSRRAHFIDAAAAAIVAAILFQILKAGFAYFVVYISSYQAIYGAVAALPFALLWLEAAWCVALFGASVAAAGPEWRNGTADPQTGRPRAAAAAPYDG
ncbi:MAG: YihY family inner membrane protein [Pseudomonadota bacterium]